MGCRGEREEEEEREEGEEDEGSHGCEEEFGGFIGIKRMGFHGFSVHDFIVGGRWVLMEVFVGFTDNPNRRINLDSQLLQWINGS